jgi:hypothetical protein
MGMRLEFAVEGTFDDIILTMSGGLGHLVLLKKWRSIFFKRYS